MPQINEAKLDTWAGRYQRYGVQLCTWTSSLQFLVRSCRQPLYSETFRRATVVVYWHRTEMQAAFLARPVIAE